MSHTVVFTDHTFDDLDIERAILDGVVDYNDRVKSGEWDVGAGRTMRRIEGGRSV